MDRTIALPSDQDILTMSGGMFNGMGSVASKLLANKLNINSLRTNDVLHKDEWIMYDSTVQDVARARLVGVADLMANNLSVNLPNPFGTTMVQHEKVSDMTGAQIDMSGVTDGDKDRLDYTLVGLPVPITHKEFSLNIRALAASRNGGAPLDTSQAQVSARRVSDALEGMLFNGNTITAGGGTIYGYTNYPARNTGTVTASWATATGSQILTDVLNMIAALQGDNMFGPYVIYLPVTWYIHLLDDFKTNSDKSTLARLLEMPLVAGIKSTTQLTNAVIMVQLTSDVIDIIVGFEPVPVMWESNGGMTVNFKVLAIMVPRLKSDYDGRCGIAHWS